MRLTAAALGDLKLDGVTDRIIFETESVYSASSSAQDESACLRIFVA